MSKSDKHMERVKRKIIGEQQAIAGAEQRRKQRTAKKFGLVPFHSDTLILKTSPTELRVALSALPRTPCGHGRCS